MERDHGWAVPVRTLGKGLERRLPADLRARLADTYAGGGLAENWAALFATLALFRDVALAVAVDLGYRYPLDLDERVTAYVRGIQARGRDDATDDRRRPSPSTSERRGGRSRPRIPPRSTIATARRPAASGSARPTVAAGGTAPGGTRRPSRTRSPPYALARVNCAHYTAPTDPG